MNRNPFLLYFLVLLTGCASSEDFINFTQGPDFAPTPEDIANYRTVRIQPDDILHIQVFSIDPVAAQPFNTVNMAAGANANRDALQLSGYLVDKEGMIDFPIIGRLKVSGLGIIEAKETIHKALEVYLKEPVVNIRLLNFRVNVLGEVASPGTFSIPNDRLTAIEAIALAGDLTVFGRRDSILLVRENNGQREYGYLDLNTKEIFHSPYYYLQQNDVLYIQPLPTKITQVRDPATRVLPWVSAFTSTAAFILSVILAGR